MKKLRVTVEGKAYEVIVEILDEQQAVAAAPVAAPAPVVAAPAPAPVVAAPAPAPVAAPAVKAAPAGPGSVLSPLAGKVVSIDVAIGAAVTEGQQVATVEAMKMNTYVYAPRAGKVASVAVASGDGVQEGSVLLTIE